MRTKQTSKRIRTLRRRRLALALITAMAAPVALAQSLPESGSVVPGSGSATIGSTGTEMTITQTTKGAIIDWGSFNIGSGYGVTFDQQFGTASVTLNRVIGFGYSGSGSIIDGALSSNGNVFIINPSGITFGSGAQVNVGGLVASALDMSDADFLSGVSSGQYRFTANGSTAGAVSNNGQLTAASGGTIGLIGSQINNAGTISATNGSVVFGATSQVTLDFFGDGLTQVTVSGNGLGVSNCSLNCNGGITSSGNVFAQGGHIEMRSTTMDGASAGNGLFVDPANGGRIWIGGNVVARTSGTRRGSVIIDAGMGNIDLGGVDGRTGNVSANANSAGENAGTIELRGNQLFTHLCYGSGPTDLCNANNRLGLVTASAFGAGGSAGEIHIDVNRFYHGGVLQAIAGDGSGGLIDINADSAEIYNRIFAFGNNGTGGTININANSLLLFRGQQQWLGGPGTAYWSASLLAYGTTTGGAVNIDAGSLVVTDLGNVTPEFDDVAPVINVTGQLGGNGGAIHINADYASIGDTWFANASGDGQGGSIDIVADTLLLDGGLVSTGGTAGGSVTTTTTGSMFAGGSAYVNAGTWLVHAPSVDIMPTSGAVSGYGAVLTDDALSSSLDGGTLIQLYADASMVSGATGNIHIGSGVNIIHATSDAAGLDMRATAGIYGSYFSIESTGGPLDLSFTANANGGNPGDGYVSFFNMDMTTSGGDIDMNADGSGVYLEYSQLSSGAGNITILGSGNENGVLLQQTSLTSAGGDISINASSVYGAAARLETADISSGGGKIAIDGDGPDGVWVVYSDLASAGGDIAIHGQGVYSGSYFHYSTVDSADGDMLITGSASQQLAGQYPFGVALAGAALASTTGDISVIGDAIGGSGILFWTAGSTSPSITTTSGAISLTSTGQSGLGLDGVTVATDSGDITIAGTATDLGATAVHIGSGGLTTNGGDISITGTGGSTGVWLYGGDITSNGGDITVDGQGFHYGVQVWEDLVSSGTGDIAITGTATGSDSNGVLVRDASLAATSGSIKVDGSAPYGTGVFFESAGYGSGNSVTTTSGAISVISSGLSGLNVADIPFNTDTGNITLQGTATGADAGVYIGSGGLHTNGGDISIDGNSAGNYGVLVSGDISSAGGNISIQGERAGASACAYAYCYGVLISGANITSNGGDIVVSGMDTDGMIGVGLALHDATLASGGGAISLYGTSNALVGVGIYTSNLDSAGGDIGITGNASVGFYGVALVGSDLTSGAGDTSIEGSAPFGAGITFLGSSITTTSGAISITSTGLTGLNGGDVQFTTDTGDITLQGSALGDDAGVYIGAGGLSTNGGDITIIGYGTSSTGVLIYNGDIASHGGDISITGSSTDLVGVQVSGGDIDSAGGTIAINGEGAATGLIVSAESISSGAGNLSLYGVGGSGSGVWIDSDSSLTATSGDVLVDGTSELYHGVFLAGSVATALGDIALMGSSADGTGVSVTANGNVASDGGDITITGTGSSAAYGLGVGVLLHGDIASGGGDIVIEGHALGSDGGSGVYIGSVQVNSGGGDIAMTGSTNGTVHDWGGVDVRGDLASGGGTIILHGSALAGPGVYLGPDAEATSDGGDIVFDGDGLKGVWLYGSTVASSGGDIAIAGTGADDAGLRVDASSSIDAGAGVVVLRAGNHGNSDAIILQGHIASTTGVNLRPIDVNDTILLGAGNGFSLTGTDLAMIDSPLLVIGSAQHAGAIRVLEAVDWDGDLTLQNQGGTGGIDLQAAVDVGDNILTLASGGDIGQGVAGGITAHSLLAIAGGDVALTAAENNVAASSVAGTAGGDFSYEDVDDLAIGQVSSFGFSAVAQTGLVSLSAVGIAADGSVRVQTASGDLTLGADVSGSSIDLIAADIFHNPGGATLSASNGWRIWARTWDGEERGGLEGDGLFDVYGCTFGQDCTGINQGNQFIYQERRLVQAPIAPETVTEWLDDDESASGAMDLMVAAMCPVADSASDLVQVGSSKDELAREWLKSRHRLRLSNCIDSKNAPGCKF